MSGVSVLVIAYGSENKPSTRLRILQYLPALEGCGFRFETVFVPQGEKSSFERELGAKLDRADVVFVQRVLTRPLLRHLRRSAKPVVFDMDDALHYIRQSQYPRAAAPRGINDRLRNAYRSALRGGRYYSGRKRLLDSMLDIASTTIVGNTWLFDELDLDRERALVVPTSVWVEGIAVREHREHRPVTLGWIGVSSNLYHLDALSDAFARLHELHGDGVELNIVSSEPVATPIVTRFTPWSLESEAASVMSFDIGLMPLQDDPFSRGKCAFKAVFCMSRGIPVVASPIGANTTLIEHGRNGWLARNTDEWVEGLSTLVQDIDRRAQMGRHARQTIEQRYSAALVADNLSHVLRSAAGRSSAGESRGATSSLPQDLGVKRGRQ